jgi:hypothetical protein
MRAAPSAAPPPDRASIPVEDPTTNAGHLSPTARWAIAAVERLQNDRARLRSLAAEVADTSIGAARRPSPAVVAC